MKKSESLITGFTLIELICVITIISIITLVAIPRFFNQTKSARVADLYKLNSSINIAAMMVRAEYISEGSNSSTSVTLNGKNITVVAGTGWPAATAAGIGNALSSISQFKPTYSGNVATWNFAKTITNCNVTYNSSTKKMTVTSTGC
jgi:prepilin-type N-terminal cleavage/methylation domain-containing protein